MKRKLLVIFIAFCISFITMVALSLFSIERFTTFTDYSDDVQHSNRVIRMIYKAEVYLKDIDRGERGYILTNDTSYLQVVYTTIDSIYPALFALERLVADNPVQVRNLIILKDNISGRLNYIRYNFDYIDSSHSREASHYYYDGRKYMLAASRRLREMHKAENILLAERYKQQQFYQQLTSSTLKSLLFIFCVVTLFLFLLLIRVMRSGMLYQEELNAKVIDLKRSHGELQDIAYAISHDLQEPLRKIQVFSNMLMMRKQVDTDSEAKETLLRINSFANRMQLLITDLVSLTNLTKIDENKSPADLNRIVEYTLIDIQDKIQAKEAQVNVQPLPTINGYESQLKILFRALIDNALKFTQSDEQPVITITYSTTSGSELTDLNPALQRQTYHCISVSDNGIGFDNKYITNIFRIFRRLHTEQSQYEGKGIGLAICQRIMTNHEGYIVTLHI